MKKLKVIISLIAVLLVVTACGNGNHDKHEEKKTATTAADKSSSPKKKAEPIYTEENAKSYVSSFLSAVTTGDFATFEKETGQSQSATKSTYDLVMTIASKGLASEFSGVGMSDEDATACIKTMFREAKYEVTAAKKSGKNFIVTVQSQPCTGLANEEEVGARFLTPEAAAASGVDFYDESARKLWAAKTLLELIKDGAIQFGYGPAKPVELTVLVTNQGLALDDMTPFISAIFTE